MMKVEEVKLPEGPELAISRDQLRGIVVGRRLRGIDIVGGRFLKKSPEGFEQFSQYVKLYAPLVENVDVKGKFMWWTIGPWKMWCTYGMSGQWTVTRKDSHVAATAWTDLPDGSCLSSIHFRDPRRFGTLKFINDEKMHLKKLATLGPDMLNAPPDAGIFAKNIVRKPNRTIVEALMDQSCVSGIGNYIKAETLFRSGISPHRSVASLTPSELEKIRTEAIAVCTESYSSRGATIRTYRNPEGSNGYRQFTLQVYGKNNCPLGHEIERQETKDGRTSHWCPVCQK